jgi:pilus assembly protein Flp/PilA
MKNFLQAIGQSSLGFLRDEEGAQVVEYALIIAVISIALVIALRALTTGATFTNFIARVGLCLNGPGPCV